MPADFQDRQSGSALVRIYAPHFCAGIEVVNGRVVRAAPILKYMLGWSESRVLSYVERKRWMT